MTDYDLTTIAHKVATREDIKDYKLEHQYSSNKGDGYTGSVRAVTIAGSNKNLDVVFKYSLRDPKAHEALPLRRAYLNEIQFYEEVVPAFKKFQEEYNIKKPFNNTAEYYGCIDVPLHECLALENIKCKNYDLWDRKQLMNTFHLELTLKTFAKFHGTSMAMKELNPERYSKLTENMNDFNFWCDFIKRANWYQQLKDILHELDIFDPDTEKIYYDKFEYYQKNIDTIMNPIIQYNDKFDVILQGDCWSNNAMYQYENMNNRVKPKNVILLDWQILSTSSLVRDLSYFFYTIAPKESFDNLEYYQKVYHDALADHLKAFGLNVDKIYPYKIFMKQWKELSLFGFMQTITLRKMMLMESGDAPDISENVNEFLKSVKIKEGKEGIYKQQMKEIFMHFVDKNFI